MFDFLQSHHRDTLRKEGLTPAQRAVVEKNVPYLARLDQPERGELEGLVRIFLAEKSFEGCGELELTDEMKLTIAAQALPASCCIGTRTSTPVSIASLARLPERLPRPEQDEPRPLSSSRASKHVWASRGCAGR